MTPRRFFALVIAAAAALAVASQAFGTSSAGGTLKGTVGPGFTITLKQNGKTVKSLKAGTYKFVVTDKASIHNFVVEREKGGTFEKTITGVGFKGTKTVKITLKKGEWKFYCAPHESSMNGEFKVT